MPAKLIRKVVYEYIDDGTRVQTRGEAEEAEDDLIEGLGDDLEDEDDEDQEERPRARRRRKR